MKRSSVTLPQIAGMTLGVLGGATIAWICLDRGELVFGLLALAGAALGYLTGVLVVPISPNETERFTVYAKVISGFMTGYLLSKLDPLVTDLVGVDPGTGIRRIAQPVVAAHFLIALCSYLITLLTVFNVRAYWLKSETGAADEGFGPAPVRGPADR